MEPEDPEFDLVSLVPVCSFEASFVSKSLSFYHSVFGFLCFRVRSEKTGHTTFGDFAQYSKRLRCKVDMFKI